jgi:hypothetical protein
VLVVGGAGTFGSRLVRRIIDRTAFDVIVAGRDRARAEVFAASLNRGSNRRRASALALDASTVTAEELRASGAFAVVDAAGPWQGGEPILARAAIGAGLHYVDLADARDFVANFPRLDEAARAAGVVAWTGASSTPALSNAVLDQLTHGWRFVDWVNIAICPGNRAPRGLSVMRSILSYVGRPVRLFLDGEFCTRPGWGLTTRVSIPGLGRRWASLCETPDLDIVPSRFAVRRGVVFRAGLELDALHLGLLAASMAVRAGFFRSLVPFSRLFLRVAERVENFGGDRGGMLVEVFGIDGDGHAVRATWSLVAEAGDGPFVPTLPALAALIALVDGRETRAGAAACAGLLSLAAIEQGFAGLSIQSEIRTERKPASLFADAIGPAFAIKLPEAVRALHSPGWWAGYSGEARVDGGDSRLGRLCARLLGFPPASARTPIRFEIAVKDGRDHWSRDFGGRRFRSVLGPSGRSGSVIESIGGFAVELALSADPDGLGLKIVGFRPGPVRLPRWLGPGSEARESIDSEGRFRFDVKVWLPFGLGRIVRYSGWLVPDAP